MFICAMPQFVGWIQTVVHILSFYAINLKAFDKRCSPEAALFSLVCVHSHCFLSSVCSSSQNDPSGGIQKPGHRAEHTVSGSEAVVGCFLRVHVHCYADDWSLWVHLAGETATNQPLYDHELGNPLMSAYVVHDEYTVQLWNCLGLLWPIRITWRNILFPLQWHMPQ